MKRAAEDRLDAERADAAAIEALLQAEPDVVDVNRAAQAQLEAERADAAAIEALLQAEPDVLDLNRAVLSSVQRARMLRVNEQQEAKDNHGAETHVGSDGWFASAAKDDEVVSFCEQ